MPKRNNRPIFLDLARIRQPVTAYISIAHRISGIFLFLSLPFVIYLLDLSLSSAQGYGQVRALLGQGAVKLLVVLILGSLAYHMFAGLRFLLIDIGVGVERDEARRTAWVIAIGGAAALLMIAGIILW